MDNSETIFPGLSISFNLNLTCSCLYFFVVGEEDELSIKEAAELLMEGMQFTGKVEVSSVRCCYLSAGGSEGLYIKW